MFYFNLMVSDAKSVLLLGAKLISMLLCRILGPFTGWHQS